MSRETRLASSKAAILAVPALVGTKSLPEHDRLVKFIGFVGVTEVRAALDITVERLDRHSRGAASPVVDAWDYLVAVVNLRPARLRHIYVLLYLWETSLRSLLDLVIGGARGPNWYRTPGSYMRERTARRIFEEHRDLIAKDGTVVAQTSAMAFLEGLYLWALHAIILASWPAFMKRFKTAASGTRTYNDERELFEDIEQTRRRTMHVRPMSNAVFKEAAAKLRTALAMLGANVDKALDRIAERDPNEEDWHLFEPPAITAPPPPGP